MSKLGVLLAGVALLGGGLMLASSSHMHALGALGPPTVHGLTHGAAYRLIVRSSLSRSIFGDQAAMQQAQTLLGRQGFNVASSRPNAGGDPFVYDVFGTYQGDAGMLSDDPNGVTLLGATEMVASDMPRAALEYITSRPVALQPGTTYAGRASLPWPVTLLVSEADVIAKLQAQGFVNVSAYTSADDLPSDWPASERGGDVFAIATYPLSALTKSMNVPSQVRSIWKVGAA